MEVIRVMGDISIIARRLSDGHVQYGWSGNGGYFKMVGVRLLLWYQDPEDVEYLFELGQTRLIGQVGSERGGYSKFETHHLTGEGFWLGRTERMIFSKLLFVDYGYFYDLDHKWYYIIPGPFRVKIPLELIANNMNENDYEFDYLMVLQVKIANFIFNEYMENNSEFKNYLARKGYDSKKILDEITQEGKIALYELYEKYTDIYSYFDDWILVKSNSNYTEIEEIIMHKNDDIHIETNMW